MWSFVLFIYLFFKLTLVCSGAESSLNYVCVCIYFLDQKFFFSPYLKVNISESFSRSEWDHVWGN